MTSTRSPSSAPDSLPRERMTAGSQGPLLPQDAGARVLRALFLPVATAILVAAAFLAPLPVFLEAPGRTLDLADAVTVELDAAPVDGSYLLTAVSLRRGTPIGLVRAFFDDAIVTVPVYEVLPPGEGETTFFDRQRDVFADAAIEAAAVGLAAAGYEPFGGDGVEVVSVLADSGADGRLAVGDVITAIDGAATGSLPELVAALQAADAPRERMLTVERDGRSREVTVEVTSSGGRRVLGVAATTVDPELMLPIDVGVDAGRIGGPSAGLMIALTVYDRAVEADLADGRVIAGTGTLAATGAVGPIGGIEAKTAAAEAAGADVFLAPAEQADAARAAVGDGGLEVIGVATFDDALMALRRARSAERGGARVAAHPRGQHRAGGCAVPCDVTP